MRTVKNNGFISIAIVVALALVGLFSLVMSGIISTIRIQNDQTMLQAKSFNVRQSAVALEKVDKNIQGDIELDKKLFKNCTLNIARDNGKTVINTKCSVGRERISEEFLIEK